MTPEQRAQDADPMERRAHQFFDKNGIFNEQGNISITMVSELTALLQAVRREALEEAAVKGDQQAMRDMNDAQIFIRAGDTDGERSFMMCRCTANMIAKAIREMKP